MLIIYNTKGTKLYFVQGWIIRIQFQNPSALEIYHNMTFNAYVKFTGNFQILKSFLKILILDKNNNNNKNGNLKRTQFATPNKIHDIWVKTVNNVFIWFIYRFELYWHTFHIVNLSTKYKLRQHKLLLIVPIINCIQYLLLI